MNTNFVLRSRTQVLVVWAMFFGSIFSLFLEDLALEKKSESYVVSFTYSDYSLVSLTKLVTLMILVTFSYPPTRNITTRMLRKLEHQRSNTGTTWTRHLGIVIGQHFQYGVITVPSGDLFERVWFLQQNCGFPLVLRLCSMRIYGINLCTYISLFFSWNDFLV